MMHDHHNIPQSRQGSAWTALDETFFRLTQDLFGHPFCAGGSALLASNDEAAPPELILPTVIQLPEQPDRFDAGSYDSETRDSGTRHMGTSDVRAAQRAAMQRHPSARRRF